MVVNKRKNLGKTNHKQAYDKYYRGSVTIGVMTLKRNVATKIF